MDIEPGRLSTPAGSPIDFSKTTPRTAQIPWGYNGLGEIVYLRTYARDLEGQGRKERWPETIERVLRGTREINARLTSEEEAKLGEHMLSLRGTVSGRSLWVLGTPLVKKLGMDGLVNCLAGETEVLTSEGIFPIRDLAGAEHLLMTVSGDAPQWVRSPVRSFGVQHLYAIELRRGRVTKTIRATAEHTWFIRGTLGQAKDRQAQCTTSGLREGQRLVSIHDYRSLQSSRVTPRDWQVVAVKDLGIEEEVFCAVVPETHSFALADNLLTGNCWYASITKPDDFSWLMDRLMVGGGVGFSVERANVYQFPKVAKAAVYHQRTTDADFIVPDTRAGWSDLIQRTVEAHFNGHSFSYSTLLVRPAGAALVTFGGTASGPTALIEGVTDICRVMCARAGKRLRSIDVLDIANIIGRVVVAGSTRRSAQIAIGDPDDILFLKAKRWADGTIPAYRANSNNTLVVDHFKDLVEDHPAFWRNFDGGSEPYGLFNRVLARTMGRLGERRADTTVDGINPCFAADTRILTSEGWRTFAQLAGQNPAIVQDLRVQGHLDAAGQESWTIDPTENGTTVNQARDVRITAQSRQLYRLTTSDGYSVRATEDHHFATSNGMTTLRNLRPGNQLLVALPDPYVSDRDSHDWRLGYLLGLVVSDVYVDQAAHGASIVIGDPAGTLEAETERLEALVERTLGELADVEPALAASGVARPIQLASLFSLGSPGSSEDGGVVRRLLVSRVLGNTAAARNWSKRDLSWLHYQSRDFKAGFISGLFYGNGSVQDSKGSLSWRLAQSNQPFLSNVQLVLQELGVRASRLRRRTAGQKSLSDGRGGRPLYAMRANYELIISGQRQCSRAEVVLAVPPHHQARWDDLQARYRKEISPRDPDVTAVVAIEFDGVEDVWCLSEDVRRTLVAEGLTARRCGESVLANRESCNLATIWLPNVRSYDEFIEISTILYKIQKSVALLPHPDATTREIVHHNLRLGQSLTGILQATEEQRSWVSPAYEALRATDREWSRKIGVRESVRLSVIQPGGTLSILPGVTSGIHGAYARYFIRRVRFGSGDPLVDACRAHGYPVVPEMGLDGAPDRSRMVVEFPASVPESTLLASEMSAVDQLNWLTWAQRNWADQAVSITVTYRPGEMEGIKTWLSEHYDREVKSVSFLPYEDHGFTLAPYEPISEAEFRARSAKLKSGGFTLVGETTLTDDDCEGGACPVR